MREAGRPAVGAALLAGRRARSCDLLAGATAAAVVGDGGDDDEAQEAAASRVLDDGGPPLPLLAQLLGSPSRPRASAGAGLPVRLPDGDGASLPPGWRPLPLDLPGPRARGGRRRERAAAERTMAERAARTSLPSRQIDTKQTRPLSRNK